MDVLQNILNEVLDQRNVKNLAKELDADENQIKQASAMLLPTLMESLNSNAKSQQGANSLLSALDEHANKDVSSVNSFFNNVDLNDGKKILGHIFKNKETDVKKEVSKQSGLPQIKTQTLMAMLAPLLLGYLGNQKKKSTNFDAGSLIGMLTSNIDMGSILSGFFTQNEAKSTTKKVTKVESKAKDDLLSNVTDVLGDILGKK